MVGRCVGEGGSARTSSPDSVAAWLPVSRSALTLGRIPAALHLRCRLGLVASEPIPRKPHHARPSRPGHPTHQRPGAHRQPQLRVQSAAGGTGRGRAERLRGGASGLHRPGWGEEARACGASWRRRRTGAVRPHGHGAGHRLAGRSVVRPHRRRWRAARPGQHRHEGSGRRGHHRRERAATAGADHPADHHRRGNHQAGRAR